MKEARHKAEAETARLEVERMSLLLEIGATKDEVCPPSSSRRSNKALYKKKKKGRSRDWSQL